LASHPAAAQRPGA